MEPSTRRRLVDFSAQLDWAVPHPLDLRRFNRFIVQAFKAGDISISAEDFAEACQSAQPLNPSVVDEWLIRYEQGVELLKVFVGTKT